MALDFFNFRFFFVGTGFILTISSVSSPPCHDSGLAASWLVWESENHPLLNSVKLPPSTMTMQSFSWLAVPSSRGAG